MQTSQNQYQKSTSTPTTPDLNFSYASDRGQAFAALCSHGRIFIELNPALLLAHTDAGDRTLAGESHIDAVREMLYNIIDIAVSREVSRARRATQEMVESGKLD